MQKNAEMEVEEAALAGVDVLADADDESPSSVYEIGYHLLPTLSEEAVSADVKEMTELLAKNGAVIVGDKHPIRMPLAYTITKRISGKILRFDEAYFGWVAFEVPREAALRLDETFKAHKDVLRHIIIRTSRDEVAAALTGPVATAVTGDIGKPKREAEAGGEMSEVALDKALKTIETEDAKVAE